MQGWVYVTVAFALSVLIGVWLTRMATRRRRGTLEGYDGRARAQSASVMALGGAAALMRIPPSRPSSGGKRGGEDF